MFCPSGNAHRKHRCSFDVDSDVVSKRVLGHNVDGDVA